MTSYSQYGYFVDQPFLELDSDYPLSVDVVRYDINNANHLVDQGGQHLVTAGVHEQIATAATYPATMWTNYTATYDYMGSLIFPVHLIPEQAVPYGLLVYAIAKSTSSAQGKVISCLSPITFAPSRAVSQEKSRSLEWWTVTFTTSGTAVYDVVSSFDPSVAMTMIGSSLPKDFTEYPGIMRTIKVPMLRLSFYGMSDNSGKKVYMKTVLVREYRT